VAIENLVNSLGRTQVVSIRYGAWTSDDYYLNNPSENSSRLAYYAAGSTTPQAWVDGIYHMVGSGDIPALVGSYTNTRLAIPSPYEIITSIDLVTNSVTVQVKCTSTPPAGNKYLRIAMIEKMYDWSVAPGSNGQKHFEGCMLDMVPDALGTLLNIAVGDSQSFTYNYNTTQVNFHIPMTLDALISAVAFVQNDQNKEVLQANYKEAGIELGTGLSSSFIAASGNSNLSGYAYNTSDGRIDIAVGITGLIPAGWNVIATSPQGAIPVNSGTQVFTVAPHDSFTFGISVDPQGNAGGLDLDANINLSSNPNIASSLKFYVTTTDVDILVIDATDFRFGSDVLNSLDHVYNGLYGVVSRTALMEPGVDLSNIETIIWSGANTIPAFYPEEVTALQSFLDGGGNLFITGQDIGNDIFGTGGQSQFAQSFFNSYLHANFVNNSSLFFLINGYTGNAITNGLSFVINNLYFRSPDIISTYDAQAIPILKYMTGPNVAGIAAVGADYKVVYLGIGFEQITDEPDRDSILVRSIRWFNEAPSGISEHPELAMSFRLQPNYPNPFNPETIIQYSLNNLTDENTQLYIYNSLGQITRKLVNENQPSGSYQVTWDGKDDSGKPAASGIYYYQLISGNQKAVQKMILLR